MSVQGQKVQRININLGGKWHVGIKEKEKIMNKNNLRKEEEEQYKEQRKKHRIREQGRRKWMDLRKREKG